MLEGFIPETQPLTEYEEKKILPVMVLCLSRHIGKDKAITNREMCEKMEKNGYDICETRVRKIINHIRINSLVERLIATNKGYFVSEDKKEIKSHISSLRGREEAIMAVRMALEEQLEKLENEPKVLS